MSSQTASNRPKVGVAVFVHDGKGNIVMGVRKGSHGAGTLHCPGGHLEYAESFSTCAIRETAEETGLDVGNVKFLVATNDIMSAENKHYITIFVTAEIVGEEKEPKALEPEKCAEWSWVPWDQMWAWSKAQAEAEDAGREVQKNMFMPLVNLYRDHPELRHALSPS